MYTNNKTLKGDSDHEMIIDLTGWKDWKNEKAKKDMNKQFSAN